MKPEDFGLTLKDPGRPERGWKALGQRRSTCALVRPRVSIQVARERRGLVRAHKRATQKRLDEARSVLTEDAIGKSRPELSRPKTINSRKEP